MVFAEQYPVTPKDAQSLVHGEVVRMVYSCRTEGAGGVLWSLAHQAAAETLWVVISADVSRALQSSGLLAENVLVFAEKSAPKLQAWLLPEHHFCFPPKLQMTLAKGLQIFQLVDSIEEQWNYAAAVGFWAERPLYLTSQSEDQEIGLLCYLVFAGSLQDAGNPSYVASSHLIHGGEVSVLM